MRTEPAERSARCVLALAVLSACGARSGLSVEPTLDEVRADATADVALADRADVVSDAPRDAACGASRFTLAVPSEVPWIDTGIDVPARARITIRAAGTVRFGLDERVQDANGGDPTGPRFYDRCVYPSAVVVSLIGKIGGTTEVGTGTPLREGSPETGEGFVGARYQQQTPAEGRLFLGYNDQIGAFGDNSGSFSVDVVIEPDC